MDNIKPLTNFPNKLVKQFKRIYKTILEDITFKKIAWNEWSHIHHAIPCNQYITDDIHKHFEFLNDTAWDLYKIKKGTITPHKDRKRYCCIQIPLTAYENSYTFSVKNERLHELHSHVPKKEWVNVIPKEKWINKDGDVHWTYQKDCFDHYTGEHPYIQNASQPHGGRNNGYKERILFSLSIKSQTYEETVDLCKEWH